MAEKSKKNTWRVILTYVTLIGLIILIIILHHQILNTLSDLGKVDLFALVLIIPIEMLNYDAQTRAYSTILKILGIDLAYKFLYRVSLELNFVATIFPSGGISGISYMNVRLKSKGVSGAQATILQLTKLVLVFFAFQVLLLLGVLLLAIGGRANELIILIAGALVTLLLVLTGLALFIVSSETRINGTFTFLTKAINRLIKVVRPNMKETININRAREVFTELHETYLQLRNNYKELKWPFIWGIIANLTEISAVYVVYVAFGHWENPGGIILAYAVANFAGVVSILPSGIGVYETLMTLVLATAGISPSLSIPVTIMYRVVNTLIQIIPGYALYQRNLSSSKVSA